MKKAPVKKRTLPTRQIITKRISTGASKTLGFVDRRPMTSFFAVLGTVLVLIFVGNFLNKPKPVTPEQLHPVKTVSTYSIGSAPKITVSAQTKKSGVIQVVSLSGGVIDKINVQEGSQVLQGDQLLAMASNYKGENVATVSRQVADKEYQSKASTYKTEKEIIKRQKELAEANEGDKEELRKITEQSISETRTLVTANEESLRLLDEQIRDLEQAPVSPTPIPGGQGDVRNLKQQRGQLINAINGARDALRKNEYNVDDDNSPAKIAELTKEIAIKQLEVQEKQLGINLEINRLKAHSAAITESLMFPTAPFNGTVQRVLVKEKQSVGQGTVLLVISQNEQTKPITAVSFVSADVAKRVSRIEPSILHIGTKATYTSIPSFVSTEAVQGTLYAVYYPIPENYSKDVVSEGFISVDMPIGMADTTMIATYIPLDAVYQTREKAYVFIVNGGMAKSRNVQLGQVYGDSVEVISGLKNGDQVILNRNIIAQDKIQVQ